MLSRRVQPQAVSVASSRDALSSLASSRAAPRSLNERNVSCSDDLASAIRASHSFLASRQVLPTIRSWVSITASVIAAAHSIAHTARIAKRRSLVMSRRPSAKYRSPWRRRRVIRWGGTSPRIPGGTANACRNSNLSRSRDAPAELLPTSNWRNQSTERGLATSGSRCMPPRCSALQNAASGET